MSSLESFSLAIKEILRTIAILLLNIKKIKFILNTFRTQKKQQEHLKVMAIRELHAINAEYIIEYLKSNIRPENEEVIKEIISYYQGIFFISTKPVLEKINKHEKKKIEIKALQLERNSIQCLFEDGDISWNIASELRKKSELY